MLEAVLVGAFAMCDLLGGGAHGQCHIACGHVADASFAVRGFLQVGIPGVVRVDRCSMRCHRCVVVGLFLVSVLGEEIFPEFILLACR